jgi:Mg/Co/Ni transporter MgtE
MHDVKKIKDLMKDIFDYPHTPYWFTVKQIIKIIKKSFPTAEVCPYPIVILIFDEKYNLLGTLTLKDILRGLEPKFANAEAHLLAGEEEELSIDWESLYGAESKNLLEKPVSEIMVPAMSFVEPDDPITKAAYLMIRHNLIFLPVLEDKRKLVGLIRMIEVFDELTNVILKS